VLGGIVWPRANRWGALASLIAAFATNFLLYYATGQRLDHWDANVFLAALVAGVAALIVVSVLTESEPSNQLSSFFGRLRTSSDGETEQGHDAPLLLVDLLRLRQAAKGRGWRAYKEDLKGFVLGWVIVIALVAIAAILLAL
jgi:hypothetical protein